MREPSPAEIQRRLLAWFDAGHRDMPWRRTKDPYRILIAEYVLQRTRVASGTPYYERFLERFPDVQSLASASEEEVLRIWEGLGYYRRARNLHAAAKAIEADHHGQVPSDAATLATLPGIGAYTAGAVASIAFGERVPAVDGNVTRVLSRVFRVTDDVTRPAGRGRLHALAQGLVSSDRPGPFNQALMELGATVCTPRRPRCPVCPFREVCLARAAGLQSHLPRIPARRPPKAVPVVFAYVHSRGRTLLVRRGSRELLGGLWALPGGEVTGSTSLPVAVRNLVAAQTGLQVEVGEEAGRVAHTFSHRRWSGAVYRCTTRRGTAISVESRWVTPTEARALPLVPFHRKIMEDLARRRPLEAFAPPRRPTS